MPEKTQKTERWGLLRRLSINFGRLMLDGAKLTFGSLVLGTVIKGGIEQSTLLQAGILASAAAALIGLVLTTVIREE
jgi:hypothetical protein